MSSAHNHRPIGYWVKLLDRRIEASFAAALAGDGLVRRHWQILNVARDGRASIDEELAPFVDAGPFAHELTARGWIVPAGEGYAITQAGREAYERIFETVRANRARMTDGLSEEQYSTVVDALERMCANLVLPCATSSSPPSPSGSASS